MSRIASVPGDGVGREVVAEATRVLNRVSSRKGLGFQVTEWDLGADRYLREGVSITEEEFSTLASDYDAILLGALGDPRVEDNRHARDILLGLRFRLDLYVNHRPCHLLDRSLSPLRGGPGSGFRLDIFRENTEGVYANLGGRLRAGTQDEVAVQEDVNTRRGVERIVRAAFTFARERGRGRVTMVDKANAMPHVGGLWRQVFRELGDEFPEMETDVMYVDAMAMDLVRRPERYQVLVTSNLFGDILSDLAAVLTGGLGLAPSANVHPGRHALFEPVHGSAPDIAGTGTANPMAAIRSVALLFEHLGHPEAAREVEEAVRAAIAQGVATPDLGGGASTREVGAWIEERLSEDRE